MTQRQSASGFRRWVAVCLVLCAKPLSALSPDDASHLILRTGFGPDATLSRTLAPLNRSDAVDALVDALRFDTALSPPDWTGQPPVSRQLPQGLENAEREKRIRARNRERRMRREDLKAWYVTNAAAAPSPLAERLVLFWHNVFSVRVRDVPDAIYSWQQHQTVRRFAAGDYRELVRHLALDPALLTYLDNHKNRRKHPNENYARELLELHTLGEGHYSETDIRELARALTGARPDFKTAKYAFNPRMHDDGEKTLFGQRGRFNPADAVEIALGHPRAARYPVERLWREFISESVPEDAIERLARHFIATDWSITELIRALLNEDAFWATDNRKRLVRSPIELVIGLQRETGIEIRKPARWVKTLKILGQEPFNPPDVAGWPGGLAWISSSSLDQRQTFINWVARRADGVPGHTVATWLSLDYQLK
ncbi:MAG: DUF1800 domain-containing protein [Pseudomonadota bacterium]